MIFKILLISVMCCLCLSYDFAGWIPIFSTPPPPKISTVCLHHEQTVAVVTNNQDGRTEHCRLYLAEQQSEMNKNQLLQYFSQRMPVHNISFYEMLKIIEVCSDLDYRDDVEDDVGDVDVRSLTSGILPGTLWCGVNDAAGGDWSKLGTFWRLDKCCRAHDLCSVKVKPFQSRYGILNVAPYTKTHCSCDQMFYHCLKKVNSAQSAGVGKLFFNLLHIKCIEERTVQCDRGKECHREDRFFVINTKRKF